MAQFSFSLWMGLNDNRLDIFDTADTLDDKDRLVIAK